MKKRMLFFYLLYLFPAFLSGQQQLADLALNAQERLFAGIIENRQKQLQKVQEERTEFFKKKEQADVEVKQLAEDAKAQIALLSERLENNKEDEFGRRKLALLNESYQVYKDIQRESEKIIGIIDDLLGVLNSFLADPNFSLLKRDHKLGDRLFYSFEDLQRLYNLILDQEKKVALLTEQEKHLSTELENRKRAADATKTSYKSKKEQIESGKLLGDKELDSQQKKDLIGLEEQLYNYRRVLDTLRIKEMTYQSALESLRLSVAKSHLTIYKEYLRIIKPAVRVTEADIIHARDELTKETGKFRSAKEKYRSEIDRLLIFKDQTEKELHELSQRYGVSVGRELDEWSREPQQSVQAYVGYLEVGVLHEQLQTYQRKQSLLDAQIELEDEQIKEANLLVQVKESYHKKFTTEEEIAQELKKYEGPRAEAAAGIARYKEKINIVADQLNTQKRSLDNISALKKQIEEQRDTIFRSQGAAYNHCFALLRRAELFEKEQIDVLSKLTGVYSGLTSVINNTLRLVNFITGELESRTIWHRPDYAITWDGVKNLVPDMVDFLTYLRTYFSRLSIVSFFSRIKAALQEPMSILIFFIKLAVLALLFVLGKRGLSPLVSWLNRVAKRTQGVVQKIMLLCVAIISFINIYFIPIAAWLFVFIALMFLDISDTYLYIFFYLLSIPYLLYLANRFIKFLSRFNRDRDYPFLAEDFQGRFFFVFGSLLYATIVIQFFREAFMLAHYYRSELPTILLAVNFIIFQISLILLIDKEQILGLISTKTDFWKWIRDHVDRFYYLILLLVITVIVMSNPYVGFGRLVLYIFFGMLYSIALFMLFYWLHGSFKRLTSRMFFINVDEVARERFTNAKTWFGITIIGSFVTLSFLGLVIGARIWGWPITFSRVVELFEYPLVGAGTEQQITLISFSKIFFAIFIGFMIAYAINKFVLDRIFDLLLVDPGVQHTVSSITQYIVIITAVFLGFHVANLGVLVNYIVAGLILGLGWVLKDPISDFVAYFIILVQRPIKIGDYVKIGNDVQGVVRKITARSVILRRKNSTTLVVPNLYVITNTIVNWNYTRNFIAFDDILLVVDYSEDPEKVREVLYNVVEKHPNILKNPKPWVRLDNFGEYGFEFMVRGFISSVYTLEKWEIASNIRIGIMKAFVENDIKIALPTRLLLTRMKNTHGGLSSVTNSNDPFDQPKL